MIIIEHRVNTKIKLLKTSQANGVEIDLRTHKKEIILSHDPFKNGISLKEWLKFFDHNFLVLNVKEEGLESEILHLLNKNNIEKFFFLDQSFPSIIKSIESNEKRCAIRTSEYESIETAISLSGKVEWIWIDYFSKFPLNLKKLQLLKELGFKLCIVSPELQNYNLNSVKDLKSKLQSINFQYDAVCTKYPELWK